MNSTTILRHADGTLRFAVIGVLASTLAACGNESINVLAPRDAAVEAGDAAVDPDDVAVEAGDVAIDSDGNAPLPDVTVDAPVDLPAPGDGPSTGCLAPTEKCSFAGECCSLACPLPSVPSADRICAAGPQCAGAGEICGSNADCCADLCESSSCTGVTPGRCLPAGEPCPRDDVCCGARCTPVEAGPARCELFGACRAPGEVCRKQTDCCSGVCDVDDTGRRRVCLAPARRPGDLSQRR